MRSRIVEYLNGVFHVDFFDHLVPYPALIYAVTIAVGMVLFVSRSYRSGLSKRKAILASIYTMIGGLVGARLFYLIVYHRYYDGFFEELIRVDAGTISWGAYLGGFAAMIIFLAASRLNILRYLDVLGSVLGIGPFLGRWSCFIHGCDFGRISNLPWAITYPHGSLPFVQQVREGLLDPLADFSLPVHPLPIYFSINGLFLLLLFTILWKKKRFPAGLIFCSYWASYAAIRFFLEFLRGDVNQYYWKILSIGQVMSLIIFLISISGIILICRHKKAAKPLISADNVI